MFVFRLFSIGLLVLFTPDFGFADPMYKTFGGSVVLDPGHKSGLITSVTWKHQVDLALEWFGQEITYYRTFKGRCDLDNATGSFTIANLTLEDSGKYTPEINNVVGGTMELKVIKPVPKPTVSMDCNNEKTVCNLTCEAKISSEFGPVTYKWKTGDTELSNDKKLSLTTKNEESSFFCVLRNPVSNSASDEFSNPISRETNIAAVVVPVVFGVLLIVILLIGVVAYVMYKRVPRVRTMWPFKYFSRNPVNAARGEDQANADSEEGKKLLEVGEIQAENKSKGKGALNGCQLVKVNEDGMRNSNHTVVSIEQQQEPLTELVSDDEGESGQNSNAEETEATAEGPGCSQESSLVTSAASPEPSSQTETLSTEASPPKSRSEETPDTDSAES